jgi:hypothetical protein
VCAPRGWFEESARDYRDYITKLHRSTVDVQVGRKRAVVVFYHNYVPSLLRHKMNPSRAEMSSCVDVSTDLSLRESRGYMYFVARFVWEDGKLASPPGLYEK